MHNFIYDNLNNITLYLSISLIIIGLYFTGRKEGWRERERQLLPSKDKEEYKMCQEKWHAAGFWQRLFIGMSAIIQLIPDWYGIISWGFLILWFAWVGYDGWTNLPKNLDGFIKNDRYKFFRRFFYSGTPKTGTFSKIDLLLGQYLPKIKFIYSIITVVVIILLYLY